MVLVNVKLDMFSQAPRMRIFWGGYNFSIRSNNFVQEVEGDEWWMHKLCEVDIYSDATFAMIKAKLAKVLATDFNCPFQKDIETLMEFAYENGNSSLDFFGFTRTGPFCWD